LPSAGEAAAAKSARINIERLPGFMVEDALGADTMQGTALLVDVEPS